MTTKAYYILLGSLLLFLPLSAQLQSYYIPPHLTDTNFTQQQDSHLVMLNPSVAQNGKLLLLIGGTYSFTRTYTYFPELAANLGYHAISVAYPNNISATTLCAGSNNPDCHEQFHQEVCYGTPVSSGVTTDSLNAIHYRTLTLLQWLHAQHPTQGWDSFFANNDLVWSKIALAGHSQGAGNALFFARDHAVDRCLMFSGTNDYSNLLAQPANWLSGSFQTPISRLFTFLHLRDDISAIGFPKQYQNQLAMGMAANGDDTTLVDAMAPPYQNSHLLYTNHEPATTVIPTPYHNSTLTNIWTPKDLSNQPVFNPAWEYMLMASPSTQSQTPHHAVTFRAFPNPNAGLFFVQTNGDCPEATLHSLDGRLVLTLPLSPSGEIVEWDARALPPGTYFLQINYQIQRIILLPK